MLKEQAASPLSSTIKANMSLEVEIRNQEKEPTGQIKFIGWDKDGTLVHQDFSNIGATHLAKFGLPYTETKRFLDICFNEGIPLKKSVPYLLTDIKTKRLMCSPEIAKITERAIKEEMKESPPVLYDDIKPTLYILKNKGYRMFVHSRHPVYLIRLQMKYLGIADFFETFIGSSHKKGDEGFSAAAVRMNVPYEVFKPGLLYVGDSLSDAMAMKRSKVPFVARDNFIGDDEMGNMKELYDIGRAKLVLRNLDSLPNDIPTLIKLPNNS